MKLRTIQSFLTNNLHILFLLSLPSTIWCNLTESRNCAVFQSNNFPGQNLTLRDGTVIGNTAEDYAAADKRWNTTGHWLVRTGFELKACKNVYLGGECQTFSGSNSPTTSGQWLSASCKSNKECDCSDSQAYLKKSVCALAYFQPKGCNVCNAPYTELELGNSSDTFPEPWADTVSSFLIRRGCTLRIYEEEQYEDDDDALDGPLVEDWSGTIGSYKCECNDDDEQNEDEHVVNPTENDTDQVEVPGSLDEIVSMIREHNYNHTGLLAAFSSATNRRSPKNAYILMIGSSGAGKSSAINNLLGNSNVTLAGGDQSTTSEILEFRIPVPVKELGVTNSELRVIDTPGLGDTRGVHQDALFLATLDDYLSEHEELKSRIPNLVLIFHHFTDNRFDGEGAKFVNMIRSLSSFRTRITDDNYSNILFVFSHLCSATVQLQENPSPRLMQFKDVIKEYSLFPKPILTAVIENKAKENELVMINGNYQLPNKELSPQNLLERFNSITGNGGDKMGQAIVDIAFTNLPDEFKVSETRFELVSSSHNKVPHYLETLTAAAFSVASTEVSEELAEAFVSMEASLKSQYPNSLDYLQKYMNNRNIRSKGDVPQTTATILELLHDMEQNPANTYLLEKGLGLKAPSFPQNIVAGHSFSILKDAVLPVSPFKLDQTRLSTIGYMLPTAISCSKNTPMKELNLLKIFDTKESYIRYRVESFGVNMSVVPDTSIFTGLVDKVKEGFYVKDATCVNNACSFAASRIYSLFQFYLNEDAQLTPGFTQVVQNLQPFNESNYDNVESWNNFFNEYGTHVVQSAVGGGQINIEISSSSPIPESIKNSIFKVVEFTEDLSQLISGDKIDPKQILPGNISHSLKFRGGNPSYHTSDLTALTLEKSSTILNNWKKSLYYNPTLNEVQITPLSKIVEKHGQGLSEKIKEATDRLLSSSLKYTPPPTPDPKILEAELERQRKEAEERERKVREELARVEALAEKQRLAEVAAQQKREREAREQEEQRRREEAERQRQLEAERREIARRQEEERARARAQAAHMAWLQQMELQRIREAERKRLEEIQRAEIIRRIFESRVSHRSSCLKPGTKILLADFTEKSVESLEIGDVLLDKDLQPTKVLGISYEFLLTQRFYGFDNQTFFFTDTHMFAGANHEIGGNDALKLYTTSTAQLFAQNPLLEYLNVTNFSDSRGTTELIRFDPDTTTTPFPQNVTVFQDPRTYPEETPIYFIQVDSPSGTYFAEGFVCRHEIPPLEYWPNTMPILLSLFGTSGFDAVSRLPYSMQTIHTIDKISDDVQLLVRETISQLFHHNNSTTKDHEENVRGDCHFVPLALQDFDLDKVIGNIFGNPSLAALGMELYGASGNIISKYLDNPVISEEFSDCQVRQYQDILISVINRQINESLQNENL